MLVLMDSGATQMCNSYFKKVNAAGSSLILRLFVNDIVPAVGNTRLSYTEAAGGGYAAKELTAAAFTVSTVAGLVQAAYAQQIFTFTGALTTNPTIYGVYIVDIDDVLICAERAPTTYTPAVNGDTFAVTPVFKLSQLTA